MKQETFSIPNISCGHCTASIENELKELEGVTAVKGDIESRSADIQWAAPATREKILAMLKEINYPAAV